MGGHLGPPTRAPKLQGIAYFTLHSVAPICKAFCNIHTHLYHPIHIGRLNFHFLFIRKSTFSCLLVCMIWQIYHLVA